MNTEDVASLKVDIRRAQQERERALLKLKGQQAAKEAKRKASQYDPMAMALLLLYTEWCMQAQQPILCI
jgi:regulator of protease activity HflC (stomatin/prohibitin superfamily)